MRFQVPFVATKLSRPVEPAYSIPRPRLATMLLNGTAYRLLLVCAGPGYGKTTLLARLGDMGSPVVWYSLGSMDRDLPVFLSHLLAGIARHYPDFGQSLREKLESAYSANKKDVDFVLRSFVNEVAQKIDRDFIIALDDYQLVEKSGAITYAVDYLLSYLPAYAHLAIASRSLPQLRCLPRLMASGQVYTIEEEDLRFTAEEVATLFAQTFDYQPDPPSLAALLKKTEGWAIALRLIDQSLRASRTNTSLESVPPIRTDTLFSYFAEEVLKKQPRTIQTFLVESSIFSRLNPDVCNTILRRADAAKVLSWLDANGLFVNRLDDQWYRYHHLFQAFLHDRLSLNEARKRELHLQAALFFEKTGDDEQAVRHYLHAKEYARAAAIAARLSEKLFCTGRFESLSHFLEDFPRELSGSFPDLLVWTGKALEAQGRFQEALASYEKAEGLYKGAGDTLGLSRTLRSKGDVLQWARAQPGEAEMLHRQALDYLGDASRGERAAILNGLAKDMLSNGNSAAALEFYRSALNIYIEEADELGELRTLISTGSMIYTIRGEFAEVLRLVERADQLAIKLDAVQDLATSHSVRAVACMFMGEYQEAAAAAERVIELARPLDDKDLEAWGVMILGSTLDASSGGRDPFAARRLRDAYHLSEENGNRRVAILSLIGLTNHYRRGGHLPEAERSARQLLQMTEQSTDQWLRAFALRHVGILEFAQNLPSALQTLTEAWLAFAKCEDRYNLASTHLWLAAVHEARGEIDDERYHLQSCLDLASANDFLALFTLEPEIVSYLLRDALAWKTSTEFVRRVLARMDSAGTQVIFSLLTHHDTEVKLEAIACLAEMGGIRAAMQLRELAKGKDERIRSAAEDGLKKIMQGPAEPLTVDLLGQVMVRRGTSVIDASAWKRKKAKALLAYLALQGGKGVFRDVLIDKLWPDCDWQAALKQLSVALHDVRQALEPERDDVAQSRYVLYSDGWYHLSLGQGGAIDVELFETGLRAALLESDVDKAISQLEKTMRLYKGELMQDLPQEEWCRAERERLQELHLSGLERLASLYERKRDFDSAIACHKRILLLDDCREEAHCALINLYVKMGNRSNAIKQYRACVRVLRDELGVPPAPSTRSAYERALATSPSASAKFATR